MGKGQHVVEVSASPDEVWAVVQNYGDLSWFPGVTSTRMDGDEDRIVVAGPMELRERLLEMNHEAKVLRYSVVEGMPGLDAHEAGISLEPSGEGCRITYTFDVAPEGMTEPMDNIYAAAAGGLKSHFG